MMDSVWVYDFEENPICKTPLPIHRENGLGPLKNGGTLNTSTPYTPQKSEHF